jgi:energy-coupling factor transporter ATP-binding protein EcfA2
MLERLKVRGFKSLVDVEIVFPQLAVLFGPNAAGKSNLLDAIQTLSRIGTSRTISEALTDSIRGYPIEAFSFPSGGLPELLSQKSATFQLSSDLRVGRDLYRHSIIVQIEPPSGSLTVDRESFQPLNSDRNVDHEPHGDADDYSFLATARPEDSDVFKCHQELLGWRTYYLDPRVAMRRATSPVERQDIGVLGEDIAPFLYRLRSKDEKRFRAVVRTLKALIPSIEHLDVDLDKRRGTLDIQIRQNGVDYSSRIVSEGTLRVLALCAIAVNPWGGSLVAFEEPENGVHPRRLELIADLLAGMAMQGKQIVVTTHSPLFCEAMLRLARSHPGRIGLFHVKQARHGTEVRPVDIAGPLFQDAELVKAFTAGTEDGLFESLMLRGMLDD